MRRPLKILHLITELDVGGAQKALVRLLRRIDRQRFSPQVACLYNGDKPDAQELRSCGVPVIDLRMTAKYRWDAFWRLRHLLQREQPALLHTWMFHANIPGRIIGRLTHVPIIITSRRNVNIGGRTREFINRCTAPLDDQVVAVCQLARQAEIERAHVSPEHVVTIYNGVGVETYTSALSEAFVSVRRALSVPLDAPLIGFVGRLHPQKNVAALLDAVRQLPDARLLVVGEGELRESLASQAQELAIQESVVFAGHRTDVPEILQALDVFVLPSNWEGLPNAVLEAMAAGLPVVATRVGGVPEVVVDGETGILVPPCDPDALADAIIRLLKDPNLRQKMGQAGRQRVEEHFSVDRMVKKTEALYERLLAEKGLI